MARARTPAGALVRLLQETADPLYVLDEERRIVFANSALLKLLGASEEALLGRQCNYQSAAGDDPSAALANILCPPAEALDGVPVTFVVAIPGGGESSRRQAECVPLANVISETAVLVKLAAVHCAEERAPHARISESQLLHEQLAAFRQMVGPRFQIDRLVGQSLAMRRVRAQAELAARSQGGVLIVGPRGSGREHLARAIHLASISELAGPLVPLPCSLLDAETVQITVRRLKRRPTGVDREQAGVLLLLDADQMPMEAQDELAGFLNLPEFRIPTLATSRRPLADLAAGAGFRHDLACLLGTLVIELPPLSERREDIPLLAQLLLEEMNAEGGRQLSGYTPDALDELAAYPWPGNIDELAEFVREACAKAAGPWVITPDLPARIRLANDAAAYPPHRRREETIVLDEFLAEIERELIERSLKRAKGNRATAARLLGISRGRLLRRIVQLGLAEPEGEPIPFEEVEFTAAEGDEE
jgi:DNA-binding NtrC family response regulator